jgi:hypothetical protein
MIDRGCEAIDEIKYLITDFAARHKNKQLVLDNYIELIAVLAYDSGVSVFSLLMANIVVGILNNYSYNNTLLYSKAPNFHQNQI